MPTQYAVICSRDGRAYKVPVTADAPSEAAELARAKGHVVDQVMEVGVPERPAPRAVPTASEQQIFVRFADPRLESDLRRMCSCALRWMLFAKIVVIIGAIVVAVYTVLSVVDATERRSAERILHDPRGR